MPIQQMAHSAGESVCPSHLLPGIRREPLAKRMEKMYRNNRYYTTIWTTAQGAVVCVPKVHGNVHHLFLAVLLYRFLLVQSCQASVVPFVKLPRVFDGDVHLHRTNQGGQ